MRTLKLHFPDQALPPWRPSSSRPRRPVSSAVPKPYARSSKATASKRCVRLGTALPIPRCASGSIASPTRGVKAWWIAPAPGVHPSDLRAGAPPRSARRPRPPPARLPSFAVELSGTRHGSRPPDRPPTQPRERPRRVKKKTSATAAPRVGSPPIPLSWRGVAQRARGPQYRARRGEIILLYEDETVLWRFASPERVGGAKPSAPAWLPGPPVRGKSDVKSRSNARHGSAIAPGAGSPTGYCSISLGQSSMGPPKSSTRSSPILRQRVALTISIK